MKTSAKVLGLTVLIITAILALGIISSRIYLNRVMGDEYKQRAAIIPDENEKLSFELSGFNSLEFIGGWTVYIVQGSEYSVEVEAPGNLLGEVELQQTAKELIVRNNYNDLFGSDGFTIRITAPDLKALTISGGADLSFDGFTGRELKVTLSGAGRIRAFNSEFEQLYVICSGAGQLDFKELISTNADVQLSGAGEVIVNMNGGELSGSISGMGAVNYEGIVGRESIKVSGLGEVNPR